MDGDLSMSFGGLKGRGRKKQDPPIERDLYLSLEEVYHGCTKKMKISRRVSDLAPRDYQTFFFVLNQNEHVNSNPHYN